MSGSVNKVILIGNLGRDPEVRSMSDGSPVVNLSLATSEKWTDKASGSAREKTEWHRIVIFNDRLCDVAQKYLRKGSKIYLEGKLSTRKWTDQSGVEKYSTEIVLNKFRGELTMLDTKEGASSNGRASVSKTEDAGSTPAAPASGGFGYRPSMDEEIPWD